VGTSESGNLADYQILDVVDRGGISTVYRALQISRNRIVALKEVRASPDLPSEKLGRFRAAAQVVAARIHHPNFVEVLDICDADGRLCLILEYVDGGTLARHIGGRPRPAAEAARAVSVLAVAVQHAHEQGIIHRDLKPANVLVSAEGLLKITDYDLVRELEGGARLTFCGMILGTPAYMAPELAQGRLTDGPATDVYGLGAILYEMLTGRPPFWADTPYETVRQVQEGQPPSPAPRALVPDLDPELEGLCLRCLERDPGARYPSARALAAALAHFSRGEPDERGAAPPLLPRS
jgi:serine/threonine-protein kinase